MSLRLWKGANLSQRPDVAYRVYLSLSGVSTLLNAMMFTVLTVYYVQVGGLNPFQLVLVGTVMEVTTFLFEIPTGVIADTYSRRLSVIIGTFITGAAFVLVGLTGSFVMIALGLALYGLGSTFLSGAREAWIIDELGNEQIGYVFLRTTQLRRIASFIGAFVGVGLASIQLYLPILLGGVLTVLLGVYLVRFMPETNFHSTPPAERDSWQAMTTTLRDSMKMVRSRPLLLWFLACAVAFGAYAEAFDRLGEAHFLFDFVFPKFWNFKPVVWFGIINAGSQLLGFAAAGSATRWLAIKKQSALVRTLLLLQLFWVGAVIAFGLAGNFGFALGAFWLVGIIRTLHEPLYAAWLNQHIDARVRATILSLLNQADALGQFTGGPLIGGIGTIFSLRAAMMVAGLALAPVCLLYTQTDN
ncbi:MAG: MFS transporter [Caldilineaceae bacterium]